MSTDYDYKEGYRVLSGMFAAISRVMQGLCPACGAEREDDDCRTCGHHSIYVEPFMPRSQESPNT